MCDSNLTFFDVDVNNETILNVPDLTITWKYIIFTITGQLNVNRHYRIIVRANNSNGVTTSYADISEF